MLFTALAVAAVMQSAPAVQTPDVKAQPPTAQERQQLLACPSAGRLVAKSAGSIKNAFHTLNQEPDAAMIKPVARNYCEASDVIRSNVSSQGQTTTADPIPSPHQPRIAR